MAFLRFEVIIVILKKTKATQNIIAPIITMFAIRKEKAACNLSPIKLLHEEVFFNNFSKIIKLSYA